MDFLGEKEIQTSLYKIVYLFIYLYITNKTYLGHHLIVWGYIYIYKFIRNTNENSRKLSSRINYNNVAMSLTFVGLAYQGKKDSVFRFILEYNSLRDFGP